MPADLKPLFHPAAVRAALRPFSLPPEAIAARPKLAEWATRLASGSLDSKKESELLPGFIQAVFEATLGYTRTPADPYTIKREPFIEVDGKYDDDGFGRFDSNDAWQRRYFTILFWPVDQNRVLRGSRIVRLRKSISRWLP